MERTESELNSVAAQNSVRQQLMNLAQNLCDPQVDQFKRDFGALAFKIVDQDWHKPLNPCGESSLQGLRTEPLPRRLDFGPLRRMARLVGIGQLRVVFQQGHPNSQGSYRLELRARLKKEYPDGRQRRDKIELDQKLMTFGLEVLRLEASGSNRITALNNVTVHAGSLRQRQRKFAEFAELVRSLVDRI
jgi:hypothetical protein